ncbi:hypothetical protein CY34DRAFT_397857 [Suillus luteus UH-Slu-Lm8-n1]|uniref:Uncharacterized protein n=1 Tax=Suillus luteus UH-Slu-Lm8-n1 TaxID=930992 RepID=A0A0C9ZLK1_9AGAM|nr:hypothetical protein CY34DRAFT_397857 [Suillus luteus UH-Slu-Lm8-n1]
MFLAVESVAQDSFRGSGIKSKVCKFMLSRRIGLTEWCLTTPPRNSVSIFKAATRPTI